MNLQEDRERIIQLRSAIKTQIRAVEKRCISSNEDALYLLKPLADNYLGAANISSFRADSVTTNNFLLELTTSEANKNAAATLSVDLFTNEWAVVKARYDSNCSARRVEYSNRRAIREGGTAQGVQHKVAKLY